MGPSSSQTRLTMASTSARLATSALTAMARAALATAGGDVLGGLSACRVVDGDVGALLGEDLRDAAADATAGAVTRATVLESHSGLHR